MIQNKFSALNKHIFLFLRGEKLGLCNWVFIAFLFIFNLEWIRPICIDVFYHYSTFQCANLFSLKMRPWTKMHGKDDIFAQKIQRDCKIANNFCKLTCSTFPAYYLYILNNQFFIFVQEERSLIKALSFSGLQITRRFYKNY